VVCSFPQHVLCITRTLKRMQPCEDHDTVRFPVALVRNELARFYHYRTRNCILPRKLRRDIRKCSAIPSRPSKKRDFSKKADIT
jgi:hypothetical protein